MSCRWARSQIDVLARVGKVLDRHLVVSFPTEVPEWPRKGVSPPAKESMVSRGVDAELRHQSPNTAQPNAAATPGCMLGRTCW